MVETPELLASRGVGEDGEAQMESSLPVLDGLETDRLILRHRRPDEAAIYR